LSLLRLPSSGIRALILRDDFPGFRARVTDGVLQLGLHEWQVTYEERSGSDTLFRTLLHEHLHARHPASADAHAEARAWRGYEEGFADGFADLLVREKAGLRPDNVSYPYYVQAYITLAVACDLNVETLWRAVWAHRPGTVREHLVRVLAMLREATTGNTLTVRQEQGLQANADRVFSSQRFRDRPNEREMLHAWKLFVP